MFYTKGLLDDEVAKNMLKLAKKIDEAFEDKRKLAVERKIQKFTSHPKKGDDVDFYHSSNGDKHYGRVTKIDTNKQTISLKSHNDGSTTDYTYHVEEPIAIGKKKLKEDVEQLDEVIIDHSRFVRVHGKRPRNTHGGGTWMYTNKPYGDVDHSNPKEVHTTKAGEDPKKSVKAWAKEHGHHRVYTMESMEFAEEDLEDIEQIDEISKKTLGSYINKAADSIQKHTDDAHDFTPGSLQRQKHRQKAIKRSHGIERAVQRITGSEKKKPTHAFGMKREDIEFENLDLTYEQLVYAFEHFEELDEISKKTLGSYIKKASDHKTKIEPGREVANSLTTSDDHYQKLGSKLTRSQVAANYNRKHYNRKKGIETAVNKLTKEEIEMIESFLNIEKSTEDNK